MNRKRGSERKKIKGRKEGKEGVMLLERETDRKREREYVCVCVCVCVFLLLL